MNKIKVIFVFVFLASSLTACFAPRCPDRSCHVKMEHRHSGQIFRYRSVFPSKVHTPLWYLTRNSEKASGGARKNRDPKTKKKFKKLLPWEKV